MLIINKFRKLFLILLSLFTFSVLVAEEEEIYLKSISDQIQVITKDLKTLEKAVYQKSDIAQLSEQLLQNPNDVALLQKRKQLFLKRGNFEAAIMDQELIVSLDSSNHELLFELAEMQYQIAKNGRPNHKIQQCGLGYCIQLGLRS